MITPISTSQMPVSCFVLNWHSIVLAVVLRTGAFRFLGSTYATPKTPWQLYPAKFRRESCARHRPLSVPQQETYL